MNLHLEEMRAYLTMYENMAEALRVAIEKIEQAEVDAIEAAAVAKLDAEEVEDTDKGVTDEEKAEAEDAEEVEEEKPAPKKKRQTKKKTSKKKASKKADSDGPSLEETQHMASKFIRANTVAEARAILDEFEVQRVQDAKDDPAMLKKIHDKFAAELEG